MASTPDAYPTNGLYNDNYADAAVPPVMAQVWAAPSWKCGVANAPCVEEIDGWGAPTRTFFTDRIYQSTGGASHASFGGVTVGGSYAVRYRGWWRANVTGEHEFRHRG